MAKYKETNEKLAKSEATTKEKTNELFALDIVKMVDIHIKYITVMMFRQKVDLLKDQNLKNHLLNMVSLTAITWVN